MAQDFLRLDQILLLSAGDHGGGGNLGLHGDLSPDIRLMADAWCWHSNAL